MFVLSERWRNGNEYLNEILQLPFYQRYLERSETFYVAPRAVLVLTSISMGAVSRAAI
jgi:quinol monooxygenase YgiN